MWSTLLHNDDVDDNAGIFILANNSHFKLYE